MGVIRPPNHNLECLSFMILYITINWRRFVLSTNAIHELPCAKFTKPRSLFPSQPLVHPTLPMSKSAVVEMSLHRNRAAVEDLALVEMQRTRQTMTRISSLFDP